MYFNIWWLFCVINKNKNVPKKDKSLYNKLCFIKKKKKKVNIDQHTVILMAISMYEICAYLKNLQKLH